MNKHSQIYNGIYKGICAAFIAGVIVLSGCAEKSPLVVQEKLELSPLTVNSAESAGLVTINSLCLTNPVIRSHISKLTDKEAMDILVGAAKSELSMELKLLTGATNASSLKKSELSGCDAILYTDVSKYSEREGSVLGADEAAKLNFSFDLIRTSDSQKIWTASYAFKDTPLSEDVISFGKGIANKGGIGFSSASRMLHNGFIQGLRQLNAERTERFLKR